MIISTIKYNCTSSSIGLFKLCKTDTVFWEYISNSGDVLGHIFTPFLRHEIIKNLKQSQFFLIKDQHTYSTRDFSPNHLLMIEYDEEDFNSTLTFEDLVGEK